MDARYTQQQYIKRYRYTLRELLRISREKVDVLVMFVCTESSRIERMQRFVVPMQNIFYTEILKIDILLLKDIIFHGA